MEAVAATTNKTVVQCFTLSLIHAHLLLVAGATHITTHTNHTHSELSLSKTIMFCLHIQTLYLLVHVSVLAIVLFVLSVFLCIMFL